MPSGSVEKAQLALELLKSAVLELAQANPDGITNSDTAKTLGLQSNYLLIRHGLLQSPDAVQLEPVEGLRHLSPSKVYE